MATTVFTSSGTYTPPAGVTSVNVLVVGGGGSGRKAVNGGPGGGAGGLVYQTGVSVTPGVGVAVVVGAGGVAVTGATDAVGNRGSNSSFGAVVAKGGGGGYAGGTPQDGGSGGGGAGGGAGNNGVGDAGTAGQGNNGGTGMGNATATNRAAGGGGGKGSVGGNAAVLVGGNGGTGVDMSAILGTSVGESGWFASGGGGGICRSTGTRGTGPIGGGGDGGLGATTSGVQNGLDGTGGGGGGGGGNNSVGGSQDSGAGGKGVVIVVEVITPPGTPPMVTSLFTTSIYAYWTAPVTGGTVTGYKVAWYNPDVDGGYGTAVDVGTDLDYTITGLTQGEPYWVKVTAYGPGGDGVPDEDLVGTTDPADPPEDVAVTGETTTTLTLVWSPPSGGPTVIRYWVRIDGDETNVSLAETHTFTGLTPGTTYTLGVRAESDGEFGPLSDWVEVDGTTLGATVKELATGEPLIIWMAGTPTNIRAL